MRLPPPTGCCRSAKAGVRAKVAEAGGIDEAQHAGHGLAWLATTVEGLRQMHAWGSRLLRRGPLRRVRAAYPRRRIRRVPGADLRRHPDEPGRDHPCRRAGRAACGGSPLRGRGRRRSIAAGSGQDVKSRLAELIAAQPGATTFGDTGLDETHAAIHEQMRKFSEAEVVPHAHEWHLKNEYIPLEVIAKVAELGVFGLTHAGGVRRPGARQGEHVHRLGGAVARLHRRRLARHPLGDRGRAHPQQRHRRAEERSTCRRSRPASCSPPRCSPSPTPAPTLPRSRRAR